MRNHYWLMVCTSRMDSQRRNEIDEMKNRITALLALAVCSGCSAGSQLNTPAQLEAQSARERLQANEGGRRVLRAIEAHGSLEAWYSTPTSAFAWEYSNQGMGFRFKSYQVADNRTRKIYHTLQSLGSPELVMPANGRFAWDGEEAWIHPASIERINPRFWATTPYYFQLVPFVLADPGLRYEVIPAEQLDGVVYDMVRVGYESGVGDSPGDTYVLYLDPDSGLVRGIRYTVTYFSGKAPSADPPKRETLFYYEDYVTVDGLTVATHFRGFLFESGQIGEFKNEAWATEISFSEAFESGQLIGPAEARVQLPPA
jgi:hypothetical protein